MTWLKGLFLLVFSKVEAIKESTELYTEQPKSLNSQEDLNFKIVESVLISYSHDLSENALSDMAITIISLQPKNGYFYDFEMQESIVKMIPAFSQLIYNSKSTTIVDQIQNLLQLPYSQYFFTVIDIEIIDSCLKQMNHPDEKIRKSSSFVIDFIIFHNRRFLFYLMDKGLLNIIENSFKRDQKDFGWISSQTGLLILSIVVGDVYDVVIQQIFDAGLMPNIIKFLHHNDTSVIYRALTALANIIKYGSLEQISKLQKFNTFEILSQLFKNVIPKDRDAIFYQKSILSVIIRLYQRSSDEKVIAESLEIFEKISAHENKKELRGYLSMLNDEHLSKKHFKNRKEAQTEL